MANNRIETERLCLHQLEVEEARRLLQGVADPERPWVADYPIQGTLIAVEAFVRAVDAGARPGRFGVYQLIRSVEQVMKQWARQELSELQVERQRAEKELADLKLRAQAPAPAGNGERTRLNEEIQQHQQSITRAEKAPNAVYINPTRDRPAAAAH